MPMQIFLSAFEDVPDQRASNARHDLAELLVIAFVSVLCGTSSCAEMAAFGRAKEHLFRDFLKLKHSIPSHDTFTDVFRMINPKALDAAFGKVLADVAALLKDGDVIAIDGKALRGARDKSEGARTRMMVSAYAARLRLTLATVPADRGTELEAAIEALGLIALRGKVSMASQISPKRAGQNSPVWRVRLSAGSETCSSVLWWATAALWRWRRCDWRICARVFRDKVCVTSQAVAGPFNLHDDSVVQQAVQ